MRAAPTHGWPSVGIGDHFDTGAPMQSSFGFILRHAIDRHFHCRMPQPQHLLDNRAGLPLELPGKAHMHQIGAANPSAHGKWPYRFGTVFAGLQHFHDLTSPEALFPIVWFIKFHTDQFSRQCETNENDPSVNVAHATPLIGISFDADGRFHQCCSSKQSCSP